MSLDTWWSITGTKKQRSLSQPGEKERKQQQDAKHHRVQISPPKERQLIYKVYNIATVEAVAQFKTELTNQDISRSA